MPEHHRPMHRSSPMLDRWHRRFVSAARSLLLPVVAATMIIPPASLTADPPKGVHWPSFRGPRAKGIADGFPTPTHWDVDTMDNVKWKTPIPGLGHSSPVVWGDRVFLTSAVNVTGESDLQVGLYGNVESAKDDTMHRWMVYCIDKKTGKVLWEQTAHEGTPAVKRHTKASHANSTPATDGKHVVAFFGTEGLFCYDIEGKLKWKKDFGKLDSGWYVEPKAQWGFASSPVIHKGQVFIQCDVQTGSFIAALDIKDGSEIWRTPRDDVPTWSTPTIYKKGDKTQVIVNGYKHIGGYDVKTGKELWKLGGGGDIPVPTPVSAHGLVFITSAHGRKAPLYAIRPTAKGDITLEEGETSNKYVAWSEDPSGAYMQTPLVYGDYLYSCRDNGILKCFDPKTGERVYRKRLGSGRRGLTASPVAADGKIYFTSEDGDVYVLRAGAEFEILATNHMHEVCMATPAISEGMLLFRTQHHLVAVAEED